MKLRPIQAPVKEFEAYFKRSLAHPLPDLVPREPRLRVSGFPWCGLKAAYRKITWYKKSDGDALKDFYCDIGTAAHTVFQRWLGSTGSIYGDWKCRNRKCRHVVHFSNKHICPKCKSEMEYVEFTVTAFRHVSGHTDGLYRTKDGKFYIIDYKTSSVRVINGQKYEATFPYQKNKAQIMAYVVLLEQLLNIKIEGWMLLYVARDTPTICKAVGDVVSDETKVRIWKTIKRYDQQYEVLLNLETQEQLDYLVATKPCKNHKYYKKHLEGFDPCELAPVCFGNKLQPLLEMSMQEYIEKL